MAAKVCHPLASYTIRDRLHCQMHSWVFADLRGPSDFFSDCIGTRRAGGSEFWILLSHRRGRTSLHSNPRESHRQGIPCRIGILALLFPAVLSPHWNILPQKIVLPLQPGLVF